MRLKVEADIRRAVRRIIDEGLSNHGRGATVKSTNKISRERELPAVNVLPATCSSAQDYRRTNRGSEGDGGDAYALDRKPL